VACGSAISAVKGSSRAPEAYNWVVMIPKDLLDILVCPVCKKPLALKENGESLKCGECHRVYPIRDNIPILLIDEAVTEPS
jgi:uncharacterized protein YbaR (Trm112 family)